MSSRRVSASAESRRSRSAPRRLRALATLSAIAAACTVRVCYRSAGIVMETSTCRFLLIDNTVSPCT